MAEWLRIERFPTHRYLAPDRLIDSAARHFGDFPYVSNQASYRT